MSPNYPSIGSRGRGLAHFDWCRTTQGLQRFKIVCEFSKTTQGRQVINNRYQKACNVISHVGVYSGCLRPGKVVLFSRPGIVMEFVKKVTKVMDF